MWIKFYSPTSESVKQINTLIREKYPKLTPLIIDDQIIITGLIDLFSIDGCLIDTYSVEIRLPKIYNEILPITREIGGKIPHIIDRHIFSDGTLCLVLSDEIWKFLKPESTIIDYLEKLLKPFLINQSYFEITGKWIFGQRSHGLLGIIEYYEEELETKNISIIYSCLQYLSKKKIRDRWPCYCESSKRLRDCHLLKLIDLRCHIDKTVAMNSLNKLEEEIKKI